MASFNDSERHPQAASQTLNATEAPSSIRLSEIISALSYALDLTEGQPMGHSVRACMIGMRLAQQIGLSADEQADLYYALLLKDAGCSSNASRLFHILNADEIRAKGDVKTTDWTRVGWESLHYALTHVAPACPSCNACRGFSRLPRPSNRIPARWSKFAANADPISPNSWDFPSPLPPAFTIWTSTGMGAVIPMGSARTKSPCSQESRISRRRWMFSSTPTGPERRHRGRAKAQRPLVRSRSGESGRFPGKFRRAVEWTGRRKPGSESRFA